MKNIKLTLAYDGTGYFGWQRTSAGLSIEQTLQEVLETILQHKIILQAASRTDAGVHANGQIVNFFTNNSHLTVRSLKKSLNQLLPSSIVILDVQEELLHFHPTLDCEEKEYRYFICKSQVQMPENRLYSWHCPHLKYMKEMNEAAAVFVGKQNFSSLCNLRRQHRYETYEREVFDIFIENLAQDRLMIKIRGKNFLYKMVRNIVGTLVYVGVGKLTLEQLPDILSSQDRRKAGITAPAHGLFLHHVTYSKDMQTKKSA